MASRKDCDAVRSKKRPRVENAKRARLPPSRARLDERTGTKPLPPGVPQVRVITSPRHTTTFSIVSARCVREAIDFFLADARLTSLHYTNGTSDRQRRID